MREMGLCVLKDQSNLLEENNDCRLFQECCISKYSFRELLELISQEL